MFFINPHKSKSELGYKIGFEFKVTQKNHSSGILYDLKAFFGCGQVVTDSTSDGCSKFQVTRLDDIIKHVLPHFDIYPCVTSKGLNYEAFKQVALMKQDGVHHTKEGIAAILAIKAQMNKSRTFIEKWEYMLTQLPLLLDPNWISAFIDGEGSFYIELADRGANTRTNTYIACHGTLSIAQNAHDIQVLAAIRDYFNALGGKATLKPKYDITSIEEATSVRSVSRFSIKQHNVVIQFINSYPLLTRKALDFKD